MERSMSRHAPPFSTLDHRVDVCVVGGGMSGLCAAIASARHGRKTLLVEDRPVLGGNASSEVRMWICGAQGRDNKETGILEEIQLDNALINPAGNYSIWGAVRLRITETWGGEESPVLGFEAIHAMPRHLPVEPERVAWSDVVSRVDPRDLEPPVNRSQAQPHIVGPAA